jgi:hypothetical protein
VNRADRDCGSAGVEVAFAVTALLMVAMFTIGALRTTNAGGDVAAAARAGARAAATARTDAGGQAVAQQVVLDALASRGAACAGGPGVSTSRAGGVATVTVTCTVNLGDSALAGFNNSKTVTRSATERIDTLRGVSS